MCVLVCLFCLPLGLARAGVQAISRHIYHLSDKVLYCANMASHSNMSLHVLPRQLAWLVWGE